MEDRLTLHHGQTSSASSVHDSQGSASTLLGSMMQDRPVIGSPAMGAVYETIARVARSSVPVLIQGETGVGKEVVARSIHQRGPRSDAPLRCINCGALPEHLVESTLFGHERGAFTGAERQQIGVFESADGGTVLLDEVGELPMPAQAALLRVLETRRVTRVGAHEERLVDVRILAATNRDLERMCEAGMFRWDLFYRLNVITMTVPPLRERTEEIEALAERFVAQTAQGCGSQVNGLSRAALEVLQRYRWPGNVRELKNVIHRAVVIGLSSQIQTEDLPEHLLRGERDSPASSPARRRPIDGPTLAPQRSSEEALDFKAQMRRAEVAVLLSALVATGGNQTEAARRLRMPLRTLVHKIKLHNLKERLSEALLQADH